MFLNTNTSFYLQNEGISSQYNAGSRCRTGCDKV